jgi:type I restriction enzyme S subunit
MSERSAEWGLSRLDAAAEIRVSNVDKKSTEGERRVRLCNYMDVYSNDYLGASQPYMEATASPSEIQRFHLTRGDVLITKDSETPDDIAVPAIIDQSADDLICGYHLAILRPRNRVDPTWLAKQLAHSRARRYFATVATGSTRYGLSNSAISSFKFPLPPFQEQVLAGQILRTLDETIQKSERLIAKLRQVKQGLLHNLLTRGVDDNGELRDPELHPEQFKKSPLGLIPRNWALSAIGKFATVHSGKTPPRRSGGRYYAPHGIPWVKTLDLNEGSIKQTDEYVTEMAFAEVGLELLPPGTVLVAMYGGWQQIGRTAILEIQATTNQAISALVPDEKSISPEYLLRALQHGRSRWKQVAASTRKDPNITKADVNYFVLPLPSLLEQTQISKMYRAILECLACEEMQTEKLRLLKQGLMEDLLTGCVRVTHLLNKAIR